jgi:hypothetical protein
MSQSKTQTILVALLTAIAALGPSVTALSGILPPVWVTILSMVVALAGGAHLTLSAKPLLGKSPV